jgi:hypothetical protein
MLKSSNPQSPKALTPPVTPARPRRAILQGFVLVSRLLNQGEAPLFFLEE